MGCSNLRRLACALAVTILDGITMIKKIILSIGLIISIASVLWGTKIIHDTYTLSSITTYMLKTGDTGLTIEEMEHHSVQSSKTVAVHLGLVIVGVGFLTFVITRRLYITNQCSECEDRTG